MSDRERYGTWCRHGKHILVADPTDQREHPDFIPADPWPCDEPECTLEEFDARMQAEELAYEEERWAEYWSLQ